MPPVKAKPPQQMAAAAAVAQNTAASTAAISPVLETLPKKRCFDGLLWILSMVFLLMFSAENLPCSCIGTGRSSIESIRSEIRIFNVITSF